MHTFPNKTDEELMAGLAAGTLDAAALLFRRYHRRLFSFYLRMGFDRANGEDMVQTVFERVIRYRHTYQPATSFRTWMYRIARNVQADSRRRRARVEDDAWHPLAEMQETAELSALQTMEAAETSAQLEKALQQLPEAQLEILLLTRYQGLKYAEVGELLGCTEGAVKLKVFRAVEQLRTIFFKLEKR